MLTFKKLLIALFVVVAPISAKANFATFQINGAALQLFAGFNQLNIGSGGFVHNIEIECDQGVGACSGTGTSTKLIRNDTYGTLVWDPSVACGNNIPAPCWRQTVTTNTMPSGDLDYTTVQGTYAIAIAPSNTSIWYQLFNGYLYRTSNRGVSWLRTTGWTQQNPSNVTNPNFQPPTGSYGSFMQVSPTDPNVVYVGVWGQGTFFTLNGGSSWSLVSTLPAGAGKQTLGNIVYFDRSDATGNTLYAGVYGSGIYKCTAAKTAPSCAIQNTGTGTMPTTYRHMIVDTAGRVWVTDDPTGNLNRLVGTTWTQPVSGNPGLFSIAVDPANNDHLVAADGAGQTDTSNNATNATPSFFGIQGNTSSNRTATDIPWLATTNEQFMSNGNMRFDPAQSNVLLFAEGIGVWHTPGPTSAGVPQWVSQSIGLEQLVSIQVLYPPTCSAPVVFSWDRPTFYQPTPNAFPANARPAYNTNSIIGGWASDYASSSPSTIVSYMVSNIAVINESGTSTDCGNTWTAWPAFPSPANSTTLYASGGSLGASTPTDWILCTANNGNCYWTVNAGTNWNPITNTQISNLAFHQNLTTNAPTAPGNCVLHFANVPTTVSQGDPIFDLTNNGAINSGNNAAIATSGIVTGTNGTITLQSGQCASSIPVSATIGAGGSGYSNGVQTLTILGGTCSVQPQINVNVTGNVVASFNSVNVVNGQSQGTCTTPPSNPATTSGGGGSGATINVTYVGVQSGDSLQFNPQTGWGFANYFSRQIVAADRVTTDKFYLYNYCNGTGGCPNIVGVYVCTLNHSASSIACTPGQSGSMGNADNSNTKLVSMPGVAGELFFSANVATNNTLKMSTNSGTSFTDVTNGGQTINNVSGIGFGKVFSPSTYASIIIAGQVNGVQGVYISKDNAVTWTLISSQVPVGNPSSLTSIACDYLTPMNCFFAFNGGSGWTYYGGINWLLKRDIDPASNDNDPVWLEKAA